MADDDDDDRHYTNHFWEISYLDRFRIFFGDDWKTYFDSHGRICRYADDTNDNLVHNAHFARNLYARFAHSLFADLSDFFALSYVSNPRFARILVDHNLEIWTVLFRFQRSNFAELILGFADNFAVRWHVPDNLRILGWLFLGPISAFE